MFKVQGKESDILNNLAGAGIVTELDSHLRDLEKNIAVAREFIKLADESYSELRHKWNLIQEEARNKTGTGTVEEASSSPKRRSRHSPIDEPAKPAESLESKIDEPAEAIIERSSKSAKSEKSKSLSNRDSASKQSREPGQAPNSTGKPNDAKPSRDHGSKYRKDKARSSTN